MQKNKDGVTSLMIASNNGEYNITRLLLKNGADSNIKANDGINALMLASQNGHFKIAQILIAFGTIVDAKSGNGSTAVILAERFGHNIIALFLLEHGATITKLQLSTYTQTLVTYRIQEIKRIQKSIEKEILRIFPSHTPYLAKLICEFSNGLENLEKFIDEN